MSSDGPLARASRTLVTGGHGFVGRWLVRELDRMGKEVVVFGRPHGEPPDLPDGVEIVTGDIRDRRAVAGAMAGADIVFHLAANASGTFSIAHPHEDFEINALGTVNVAEAALQAGVERLVHVSSASVYGVPLHPPCNEDDPTAPILPYGASKLAAEAFCRAAHESNGLPVVVARPFCIYGEEEDPARAEVEVSRYLRWHLHGLPIRVVGDADAKRRDFVSVHDVARALVTLADRGTPGDVVNVGSGTEVSMRQLVDVIGAVTGRQPEIEKVEPDSPDTFTLLADNTRLRSLGWAPQVGLEAGIAALVPHLEADPRLPGVDTTMRADHLRAPPPDFDWVSEGDAVG